MAGGIVAAGLIVAASAAARAAQPREVLKFRTGGTAAVTEPSSVAMDRLSKVVRERSGGKVDFTHFGGGQIAGDPSPGGYRRGSEPGGYVTRRARPTPLTITPPTATPPGRRAGGFPS